MSIAHENRISALEASVSVLRGEIAGLQQTMTNLTQVIEGRMKALAQEAIEREERTGKVRDGIRKGSRGKAKA